MFKRILTETDMLDYIINFIPVPLVVTDEEYMIVESNKSASSLLALNEETSLTGTPLSDFFPNTQSDGVNSIKRIKTAAEQAEEGEEISLELLTKKITGKVFTSKITFSVIPKENGHLLLLSIVDLSHEYDLINKVKVKASDLVNIIKDSPNPIFLTDDNFNIKIANRAAIALSGYTHETLTKMNMNDFDYISEEGDRLDIILSGSERSKAKSIIRFPSGEKIVERNAIVVSKDEKKSGEILISFNDLTESERLNREISDKAAWYESILDAVPFPISVTDLEKRWTFVNTATETEVGSSRQEIIGKKCTFWGNPSCNTNNCPFDQLKSGRTVIELIIGDKIYEAHSNYVHDSSGNDTGVTILLVDVTKLRRVSSYMEQSVRNITGDLKKLADGTSDLSLITIPADKYTKNEEKYFIEINNAISEAKTSLSMLVEDSLDIASAAVEGYLYIRSDPDNHKGQYAKVIEGINETVDSIMVSITEAMRVAEEYASCNFTAKIDPSLPFNKDWANFKAALDNISIQVSVTIHKIADDVEILVNSCRETDEHIKSMSETADNLITHVENVSINAEEGNKGISGLYHTINAFSQTTGEVSQKTEQISKLAGESNDLAKQGIDLAQTSEKGMQTITDEAGSLTGIIEDIQAEMAQIGKIVKIITEIANQTNLLALNAAIEAARAGEAGRGFSVVAAEVKSLAGESRQSAETIGEMILSLQKKSQDAFSAAQRAGSAVEAGSSSLKETLDVFNRLANAVDEISEHLSEVSNMSEKQTVAVEEITHNAEQVAGLIDNTSHDATESAALTGETIKLIVGVTNQVEEVKSVSQQLSDDIDKFTV